MSTDATPAVCPHCSIALVSEQDEPAWCERCEHGLDSFPPDPALPWPWSAADRLGRRLGFASDARLATASATATGSGLTVDDVLLRLISLIIMAAIATVAGFGLWLMIATRFTFAAIVIGMVLVGFAYAFRPRLGTIKWLTKDAIVLTAGGQPRLFALLQNIAAVVGTRMPDVVILGFEWNASAVVVGWRRRRVLTIGLPLWTALRPQERVALLGHEFGHFVHDDSYRHLLAQPALTSFGLLADAIRAPQVPTTGVYGLFALPWRILSGLAAALLTAAHIGLNVAGSRERRRTEIRAERIGSLVAGSEASLSVMDVLALQDNLSAAFDAVDEQSTVLSVWHERVERMRATLADRTNRLRQLTNRTEAWLFASHPSPGRRHDFLSRLPHVEPAVILTREESQLIDAELEPYARECL